MKKDNFCSRVIPSFLLLAFTQVIFSQQINIDRVELMPNLPQPYEMRDWNQVAVDYDSFIFDFDQSGEYLPLIWWNNNPINYPEHSSFGLHTYVGTNSPNSSETINLLPAVVSASLVGIDKSAQDGNNWVLMCEEYFNNRPAENVYLNAPSASSGSDWWYDTMPNIFFYQLYDLYPGTGHFDQQFTTVADRWLEAIQTMGGSTIPWQIPEMDYRGWFLETMTPNQSGVHEPEAAGALAWILYSAYVETGNETYRIGAEWALEFLNNENSNPSYELQLAYGALAAARMNAELGTVYDVDRILNWCFDVGPLRNWGVITGTWGAYDVDGLVGEALPFYGYGFAMNTFEQVGALAPLVKYDDRYTRAIGKWILNAANASRLYYHTYLPNLNQDGEQWAQQNDPLAVFAHEAIRQSMWGNSPFATGDAVSGGWAQTNFALYGASHVGILGGIIRITNIEGILQLDVNRTDYFNRDSFPTYLLYNPHSQQKSVFLDAGDDMVDIYDAVSNSFLQTGVTGPVYIDIAADEAVLLVLTPTGGALEYENDKVLVNGIIIDHNDAGEAGNHPPRIKSLATENLLVIAGTEIQVYCTAGDADGDVLDFNWSVDAGDLVITGSAVVWTVPLEPGSYQISCTVSDDEFDVQESISIEVFQFINHDPQILSLSASPRKVHKGQSSELHIEAEDEDGHILNYNWSADEGSITGSGETISWLAPELPGNYLISCSIDDGFGGVAADDIWMIVRDFTDYQPGEQVLYFPFAGNAQDMSGFDNDGIVYGAVLSQDEQGNSQSAYYFDGINDYIRVDNTESISVQDAISVCFHMRINQFYDREAHPISHGNWENRWKTSISNGRLRWTIRTDHSQNNGIIDLDTESYIPEDEFHHIAVTYSGQDVEIYIDGKLDSFGSWTGALLETVYDLTIAQVLPGNNQYNFNGILDDVRIFDYALAIQEIKALEAYQACYQLGDLNCDSTQDVADIVIFVSLILEQTAYEDYQLIIGDINNSTVIDILDIVMLIYIILDN